MPPKAASKGAKKAASKAKANELLLKDDEEGKGKERRMFEAEGGRRQGKGTDEAEGGGRSLDREWPKGHTLTNLLSHKVEFWREVQERTVVLSVEGYNQCRKEDFISHLESCVSMIDIDCFGSFGAKFDWHITFKSVESANGLIEEGDFIVKDQYKVNVRLMSKQIHTAYIHGVPFWVPNSIIADNIERLVGHEVEVEHVKQNLNGFECFDTERKVLSPKTLRYLPDFVKIVVEELNWELKARTKVPGRILRCSKCKLWGHPRKNCVKDTESPEGIQTQISEIAQEEGGIQTQIEQSFDFSYSESADIDNESVPTVEEPIVEESNKRKFDFTPNKVEKVQIIEKQDSSDSDIDSMDSESDSEIEQDSVGQKCTKIAPECPILHSHAVGKKNEIEWLEHARNYHPKAFRHWIQIGSPSKIVIKDPETGFRKALDNTNKTNRQVDIIRILYKTSKEQATIAYLDSNKNMYEAARILVPNDKERDRILEAAMIEAGLK